MPEDLSGQPEVSDPEPSLAFPVVGIGASAGGLKALWSFFGHIAPDSGMAFVIIVHLAPELESNLASLLQQHTSIPVTSITESTPVTPNHMYVIPPGNQLELRDGVLHLAPPNPGRTVPIDHFFRTLAATQSRLAAAVILSGTGSDGMLGLKRIKEAGGVVCVQDPQEADFDGMPRSAITTGLVDFVLPVAALAEVLVAFWRRGAALPDPILSAEQPDAESSTLREIFTVLRTRTGHDFSQYKRPTMLRRIARRTQVTGVPDLPAYLELLRGRADEVQALLQDLLISVTNFFRDQAAWTAFHAIIPQLFANKTRNDQVRVWIPACATGEEAYTVAMLLTEYGSTLADTPPIQVFATDIDEDAIALGRQGIYPETIAGDLSPERLGRFFTLDQGRYRVRKELRERVLLAAHNLLRDPPFSNLDVVTCRNLLIYLNREAQVQVIRLFHFSLRSDGYLLLGSSESIDGVPNLYSVVDKTQRLFQRRTLPHMEPPPITALARPTRHLASIPARRDDTITSFASSITSCGPSTRHPA